MTAPFAVFCGKFFAFLYSLRYVGGMGPIAAWQYFFDCEHGMSRRAEMKQWKAEAAVWLYSLLAIFRPIEPKMWRPMAHAFSRSPGWMPTMFPAALFGATVFLEAMMASMFNGAVARSIGATSWLTWGLVSCLAISIGCVDSIGNSRRLGLRSVLRPRIWFELGRACWHAAVLAIVLVAAVSFIGHAANIHMMQSLAWSIGGIAVISLLVAFAIVGTIGIALTIACWRIPPGRAFECVVAYLPLIVALYLFYYSVDRWPPNVVSVNGAVAIAAGVLAAAVFTVSFVLTVYRMQRWEDRAKRGGDLKRHLL